VSQPSNPDDLRRVTVNTLQLAQFRAPGNEVEDEEIQIRWFLGNVEQVNLVNQFEILATTGNWRVEADFLTKEVRSKLLEDSATFVVS